MTYAAVPPARRRPSVNVGNACAPSQRQQSRARVVCRHDFLLCPAVTLAARKSVASPALVNTDENEEGDDGGLSFGAACDGGELHRGRRRAGRRRRRSCRRATLAELSAELARVGRRRNAGQTAHTRRLQEARQLLGRRRARIESIQLHFQTNGPNYSRCGTNLDICGHTLGWPAVKRPKTRVFRARPAWRCAHKLHCEKCAS
jgi:hypothetical protein